jgi:hypothetical protein
MAYISKKNEGVTSMMEQRRTSPSLELEAKYKGKDLTKESFARCISYAKQSNFQEEIHEETVDVLVKHNNIVYRVSLAGKDTIQACFKTNKLDINNNKVSVMKKSILKGVKSVFLEDFDVKVDLKEEESVKKEDITDMFLQFPALDKGFRFKKRFSYTDIKRGVRLDLTLVKSSPYVGTNFLAFKSMVQSGVFNTTEQFEAEIEIVDIRVCKYEFFIESIKQLYLTIVNEQHFMGTQEKNDVLHSYLRLCHGNVSPSMLKMLATKPKDYFIGPQPITLELKNVIPPELGVVSILNGYTVTEKADGERYLLYVGNDGKCYFINNRLSIKYTGIKINRLVNSIFDGELITTDKMGNPTMVFAIFDVYWYQSQDVRALPLVAKNNKEKSRLNISQTFSQQYADSFKKLGTILNTKQFYWEGDIFDASKTILQNEKYGQFPYKIDGLIYTPQNFAVGAQFENDIPNAVRTWDKVFKWKPPHDNTIDFLVVFDRDDVGKYDIIIRDGDFHKSVSLFVGYNPASHERLTAKKYLTGDIHITHTYLPKEFCPDDVVDNGISHAYLTCTGGVDANISKIVPKCINGDAIDDNSIVEFAYDVTKGSCLSQHWVPLRVRKDKTEMYRKFGLSHTANDYMTALNVWRSIQYPVTENIISGLEKISKNDIIEDDVYFSSTLDRNKYASIKMKNFHNEYIKKGELVMRMPKGSSLFDIGCGKAGDLKKWMDAGFKKVLGLDVVRDNIENRKDGAYARTIEAKKRFGFEPTKTPYIYLTMNCAERITSQFIEGMEDEGDKQVAKILWGMPSKSAIEPALLKFKNFATSGFDVVSCQFATHYFFETETTLDNFVYNVANNLKQGGYFIGTCLDGQLIKQKLAPLEQGQFIEGQLDGRVVWNIKKLYKDNRKITLGEQIEVFMESIGKPIKEFVVDFNLFQGKLAAKGIHPLSKEDCASMGIERSVDNFKNTFAKLVAREPKTALMKEISMMSDVEKEYSFMNMWFIFKKY